MDAEDRRGEGVDRRAGGAGLELCAEVFGAAAGYRTGGGEGVADHLVGELKVSGVVVAAADRSGGRWFEGRGAPRFGCRGDRRPGLRDTELEGVGLCRAGRVNVVTATPVALVMTLATTTAGTVTATAAAATMAAVNFCYVRACDLLACLSPGVGPRAAVAQPSPVVPRVWSALDPTSR